MACGDKYKHLVVTSSGYTPESPGLLLPFVAHDVYAEWYELAKRLAKEAHTRFLALGAVECEQTGGTECGTDEASGGSYPRWNALLQLNNQMAARAHDLTGPFWAIDRAKARAAAQTVITDAICLMEQADNAILAYGGTVPTTPGGIGSPGGATPAWLKWAVIGGSVLVIGVATIVVARRVRRPARAVNPHRTKKLRSNGQRTNAP